MTGEKPATQMAPSSSYLCKTSHYKHSSFIPNTEYIHSSGLLLKLSLEALKLNLVLPLCGFYRDGVSWCGVFCAGYNAVEQLTLDDEVDMFNIVRLLRVRRPELIPSFVSTPQNTVHSFTCC